MESVGLPSPARIKLLKDLYLCYHKSPPQVIYDCLVHSLKTILDDCGKVREGNLSMSLEESIIADCSKLLQGESNYESTHSVIGIYENWIDKTGKGTPYYFLCTCFLQALREFDYVVEGRIRYSEDLSELPHGSNSALGNLTKAVAIKHINNFYPNEMFSIISLPNKTSETEKVAMSEVIETAIRGGVRAADNEKNWQLEYLKRTAASLDTAERRFKSNFTPRSRGRISPLTI